MIVYSIMFNHLIEVQVKTDKCRLKLDSSIEPNSSAMNAQWISSRKT